MQRLNNATVYIMETGEIVAPSDQGYAEWVGERYPNIQKSGERESSMIYLAKSHASLGEEVITLFFQCYSNSMSQLTGALTTVIVIYLAMSHAPFHRPDGKVSPKMLAAWWWWVRLPFLVIILLTMRGCNQFMNSAFYLFQLVTPRLGPTTVGFTWDACVVTAAYPNLWVDPNLEAHLWCSYTYYWIYPFLFSFLKMPFALTSKTRLFVKLSKELKGTGKRRGTSSRAILPEPELSPAPEDVLAQQKRAAETAELSKLMILHKHLEEGDDKDKCQARITALRKALFD